MDSVKRCRLIRETIKMSLEIFTTLKKHQDFTPRPRDVGGETGRFESWADVMDVLSDEHPEAMRDDSYNTAMLGKVSPHRSVAILTAFTADYLFCASEVYSFDKNGGLPYETEPSIHPLMNLMFRASYQSSSYDTYRYHPAEEGDRDRDEW